MSRRIEIAIPPKGARYNWPTYRLTEADLVLLMKACTNARTAEARKALRFARNWIVDDTEGSHGGEWSTRMEARIAAIDAAMSQSPHDKGSTD